MPTFEVSKFQRSYIRGLIPLAVFWLLLQANTANAQYSSWFYYRDPRTGFTYSQGAAYGQGYYSGGFTYSTPRQSFSSNNGYGGGRYWSGLSYATSGTTPVRRPNYYSPTRSNQIYYPVTPAQPVYSPMVAPPNNVVSTRQQGASMPTAEVRIP